MCLFADLCGIDGLELLASGFARIIVGVQAYRHFKELLVRPQCLGGNGEELRVHLQDFQVAFRHMVIEVYLIGHRVVTSRKGLLRL